MSAKFGALLTVIVGWIAAIAIFLFLRTLENGVILWLWILIVLAFLPRETWKVIKLFRAENGED